MSSPIDISAKLNGLDKVGRNLENLAGAFAAPAAVAAGDALADAVYERRESQGLSARLERVDKGARQAVGASDPESVVRELGSLAEDATPWLAPSLPAARGPMRAAAAAAVVRALSRLRNSR